MPKNRTKNSPRPVVEEPYIKDFLDMVAPSVIDFKVDHYLCGNTCRCVWALREYPTSTDEQAILRHLGEMDGVTIRIYTRQVTPSEERRIIHNAANKHRMSRSSTEDLQQTVTAEANLQDVVTLVSSMHRNREPLLHCAVFLELTAPDYDALKLLQTDVLTELVRSKLNVDRLMLRQQEGFVSVMPAGRNAFGAQFERVLPASSVANLYPFNYSGKTDPHGFYIGKDKYGANNVSVGTTIIEYIRNTLKRVRKKESNLIMASQNLEDFDREGIRELTKPLFAIPPHQFIFNCGSIDKRFYMDLLQLEEAEYNLIRFPQRGVCLFKCGNERYLLEVHAPAYKEALFGTAGGR